MKRINIIPHKPLLPENAKESTPVLINEISHLLKLKMRDKDNDMSQESTNVIIMNLAYKDGVTQQELVNITHLKPPTVSVALSKLEKLGYISRQTDELDMRAIRVFLSEKGRVLYLESFKRLSRTDDILMKGFSDTDSITLIKLLTKMRNNLLEVSI